MFRQGTRNLQNSGIFQVFRENNNWKETQTQRVSFM